MGSVWPCRKATGRPCRPASRYPLRRLTLGADKRNYASRFFSDLRKAYVLPHVAQKSRYSAIDARTTRHEGYAVSQTHLKRIEEPYGWANVLDVGEASLDPPEHTGSPQG